jgi:hypothetical protein
MRQSGANGQPVHQKTLNTTIATFQTTRKAKVNLTLSKITRSFYKSSCKKIYIVLQHAHGKRTVTVSSSMHVLYMWLRIIMHGRGAEFLAGNLISKGHPFVYE